MKDSKYIPDYERYWKDEIKAHKLTIENNIELRDSVKRLVSVNEQLVKLATPLAKDKDILLAEVVRLNGLIKELQKEVQLND